MTITKGFASDNNAGVHLRVMEAITAANKGHVLSYGDDEYTARARKRFAAVFGQEAEVYFVYNGTAANVLGLRAAAESYNSVICSDVAHINVDECGAPEKFTGCKLLPVPTNDGKLTVAGIKAHMHGFGNQHHTQPRVISVTQATEYGTVYTPEELHRIADYAHQNGMVLHMDGARLANAAAGLRTGLKELTGDAGVDVLSFGGTKNGLMFGEAVVFFNRELARNFIFIRKQGMQLTSKMRFIAAQFEALLTDELWLSNARHANEMAQTLAAELGKIPGAKLTQKVEVNAVFAVIPMEAIPRLQEMYYFYVWDEGKSEVRLMTSFDTREEEVHHFAGMARETISCFVPSSPSE